MRLIDKYNDYKERFPKYVIIIKCGNFYEVFNEDSYVIHNLCNYKVRIIGDYRKLGFPILAYNKVIDNLNKRKVNYIIVNEKDYIKNKFNKNNYDKYLDYTDSIQERIDIIYNKLNKLKDEKSFIHLLCKIEDLL